MDFLIQFIGVYKSDWGRVDFHDLLYVLIDFKIHLDDL